MELKPNMYIRTPLGIDKIIELIDGNNLFNQYECEQDNLIIYKKCNDFGYGALCFDKSELKASYNIIDLIEVGDYVNRLEVIEVRQHLHNDKVIVLSNGEFQWSFSKNESDYDIKTIVTKEQFESMSYRIGD